MAFFYIFGGVSFFEDLHQPEGSTGSDDDRKQVVVVASFFFYKFLNRFSVGVVVVVFRGGFR